MNNRSGEKKQMLEQQNNLYLKVHTGTRSGQQAEKFKRIQTENRR